MQAAREHAPECAQGCTQPLAPPAYLPRRSSGRPASRAGWWSPARPPRARQRAPCSQRRRQTRRRAPSPAVCARAGHTDQHSRGRVAGRYWPLCLLLPTCTLPIVGAGEGRRSEIMAVAQKQKYKRLDRGNHCALEMQKKKRPGERKRTLRPPRMSPPWAAVASYF